MAKILVIDDDEQCSEMLKMAFEQAGHAVVTAHDGLTGLKAARAGIFDLIITDVLMPEKDGLELIKDLRRERPGVDIIAISGGGLLYAEDCLKMARLFGARHVLRKPLDIMQLLQIAETVKKSL